MAVEQQPRGHLAAVGVRRIPLLHTRLVQRAGGQQAVLAHLVGLCGVGGGVQPQIAFQKFQVGVGLLRRGLALGVLCKIWLTF